MAWVENDDDETWVSNWWKAFAKYKKVYFRTRKTEKLKERCSLNFTNQISDGFLTP
jgi:hypothetical protein